MAIDQALLSELESQHDLPSGLLHAVMRQESGGNADATSTKGARGYFQFMPATAQAYGVTDPSDFKQSATGAARYMADLHKQYQGDLTRVLAAYNAGPSAVAKFNGVPPYPETQNYVRSVMGKMADMPPDPDSLPPDPDQLGATGAWGGEGNKRPAPRDPFSEMDKNVSSIEPIVGSIAGGIAGGAIGSGVAPGAGTVVGGAAGGSLGTFVGTLAAISRAQQNGSLSDIPVDQKLKYAAKAAGIDLASGLLMGGVMAKLMPALSKFFKPSEMSEVEEFFKRQGLQATTPEVGPMAPFATKTYKDAATNMKQAVQDAVQEVASNEAGIVGNPTKAGTQFQSAISLAHDKVSKFVDPLFEQVARGTPVGDTMVKPNADMMKFAKDTITELKAQHTYPDMYSGIRAALEEMEKGKPLSVADLISLKRGIYAKTDFASPDVVSRSLDQRTKTSFANMIDDQISEGLKPYPKANAAWQTGNATYEQMMSKLRSDTMMAMVKKDPLSVADYVARNASPTVMNELEQGLGAMVRTGAMNTAERDAIRAGVRQNWIIQNLGTTDKAATLGEALNTSVMNPALEQTFNYVFRDSPSALAAVSSAAKAAAAIKRFEGAIPASASIGPGAYATTGAAGAFVGGTVGSVGAMGALRFFTGTLPKALARAATNDDRAILNQIRAVSNWAAGSGTAIGAGSQIPNSIMQMMQSIDSYAKE